MTVQADGGERQIISFEVNGQEFGLDVRSVRELRGYTAPTAMPDQPAYIKGVINLRGTVMPVVDLRVRLVDAVCETYIVQPQELTPPPAFSGYLGDNFVSGVISNQGKMIVLLDAEALYPKTAALAA